MIITKGIYVLVISINKDVRINVGVLGSNNFVKGLYAYVDSAQKSIETRVERHLRKAKQKFWHIDLLLDEDNVEILEVLNKEAGKQEERKTAKDLSQKCLPINGFGSSDCKCKSHFFKPRDHQLAELQHLIARLWPIIYSLYSVRMVLSKVSALEVVKPLLLNFFSRNRVRSF